MDWILIRDIVVSVIGIGITGYIGWMKFREHPGDKYHNDSWKEDRKRKK